MEYLRRQLDKVDGSEGVNIKIDGLARNSGSTKWLYLTPEEFGRLVEVLTNDSD